jgi:RHS repeat-associated protein
MKIVRKVQDETVTYDRTDLYYNEGWQVLEERTENFASLGEYPPNASGARGTVTDDVKVQYVWDIRYIDAPVLRWRDTGGDPDLDETLYYCQDANMNVTALVETDGDVAERYVYDPYGSLQRDGSGNPLVYSANWSSTVTWPNSKKNEILYCGYRFDPETGLYHVRYRYYHPNLGRWLSRDPLGYADWMNLYEYVRSSPRRYLDPHGTRCGDCCPPPNPKDNYYDIEVSEPKVTPRFATPSLMDWETQKAVLTGITIGADVQAVGGGAAAGLAAKGTGAAAVAGAAKGAASRVAKRGASIGLRDACYEGVDEIGEKAVETGYTQGVRMWVKVRYKSCDPCWGFNPMRSWNPLQWFFSDYEMREHEKLHRCEVGSVKKNASGGVVDLQGNVEPGVYDNEADAMQYAEACKAEAIAAL